MWVCAEAAKDSGNVIATGRPGVLPVPPNA
jgi:hypothetical protein